MEKLAVLFADICGSTALYDNLGDEAARRLIARCIAVMEQSISVHRGALVKTIGDEIMATFPGAKEALMAACEMQIAMENERSRTGAPVYIRIGFNYGEVIRDSGDVFGNVVNIAARVAAITRASQIMATQPVFDALSAQSQGKMRKILRTELKGRHEQLEIYQVVCRPDDMHSTRSGMAAYRKSAGNRDEMLLSYRGQSIKVDKERRSVTLGRGEACDLAVRTDFASRLHCHIELRFGKFVLADSSTNGTYVRFGDGSEQHITREEIILHGNGSIVLGQSPGEGPDEQIEFSVASVHVPPAA